jgi:hypothetical protein
MPVVISVLFCMPQFYLRNPVVWDTRIGWDLSRRHLRTWFVEGFAAYHLSLRDAL